MQKNEDSLITNLKKADSFTVQRSWPLYALWKSDLTLAEFKILDFYLSRINSHEPNKRKVIIYKKELEELFKEFNIYLYERENDIEIDEEFRRIRQ